MYSSLWHDAVLFVLYTLGPALSCSELELSVAVYWGMAKQQLLNCLFASPNLGLERDLQPPYDLNMYQMEQIQRDFSALLRLAISLCFLVSYLALQPASLFCRKVTAEYRWTFLLHVCDPQRSCCLKHLASAAFWERLLGYLSHWHGEHSCVSLRHCVPQPVWTQWC